MRPEPLPSSHLLRGTVLPAPALLPDIPGYLVIRELARGGMGVVCEAVDRRLKRTVALKVLADAVASDPEHRARALSEAEAVARLRHPNVVPIYEIGEHLGRPFLALELVRGGSLGDRLRVGGALPPDEAVALVRAVAGAVQHAHDRGVIHRDLKPANILLEPPALGTPDSRPSARQFPTPKVADFGLAKLAGHDSNLTRTGVLVGTPRYLAPEVIRDSRSATPSADVWALGVVLYECLTGKSPFAAGTLVDTLLLIRQHEPPPVRRLCAGLPRGLDAVCRKALAKDPARRYHSAQALADDLGRVTAGRRVHAWADAPRAALARAARAGVVVLIALTAGAATWQYAGRARDAAVALRAGRDHLARAAYPQAEREAIRGLSRAAGLPGLGATSEELARLAQAARRGRRAAELHELADRLRYEADPASLADAEARQLAAACDALWAARHQFAPAGADDLGPDAVAQLRADLLDVALLSAALRTRSAEPADRRAAAARLAEAGELCDAPLLGRLREAVESGRPPTGGGEDGMSAWELYALGRFRLGAGDAEGAVPLLRRAVELEPSRFWPNFHAAVAAHRCGRPAEAAGGFSACLAVAPNRRAPCYYNRAVAHEATGDLAAAARDLNRALELEPGLAVAARRREALRLKTGSVSSP